MNANIATKANEYYKHFPDYLKSKLLDGTVKLPTHTLFKYSQILAYRCISRQINDNTPFNIYDMRSYYEEGKRPRGRIIDDNDPFLYSVSLFKNLNELKNILKFPRPQKKIAKGYIYQEGGPQYSDSYNSHINWWLFKNVNFDSFIIMENLNE